MSEPISQPKRMLARIYLVPRVRFSATYLPLRVKQKTPDNSTTKLRTVLFPSSKRLFLRRCGRQSIWIQELLGESLRHSRG